MRAPRVALALAQWCIPIDYHFTGYVAAVRFLLYRSFERAVLISIKRAVFERHNLTPHLRHCLCLCCNPAGSSLVKCKHSPFIPSQTSSTIQNPNRRVANTPPRPLSNGNPPLTANKSQTRRCSRFNTKWNTHLQIQTRIHYQGRLTTHSRLALPPNTSRSNPPRNLPRHTPPRLHLQHPPPLVPQRLLPPTHTILRPWRSAELLCEKE